MTTWPRAVAAGWHPVAFSGDVRPDRVHAAELMGTRLAVMRDAAGVFVLDDRCPHRGAPLSRGRAVDGIVSCPYHGWRFARDGICVAIPGMDAVGAPARALPSIERAGLVWSSLAADPAPFPRLPPALEDATLDRFWWPLRPTAAGLLDALENHLDPAHPHYVHPWMVRSPHRRRPVSVAFRSGDWGAEAIYSEQVRPSGILPRLLEGKRSTSIGRLYPPTIGEVAFAGDRGTRLSVVVIFQPVRGGVTRPWAHFATQRGKVPTWAKAAVLKLLHRTILRQDRRILALQQAWRGEDLPPYAVGPFDLMGPVIWRLANALHEPARACTMTMHL